MSLLQNLNWRYATKKMDPSKKVEQDKLERILEAVRLTPTSSGLQPYQVLVITNQEIKEKNGETMEGAIFCNILKEIKF